jgi:alkylation response protein AidB-like acyl-CoA dehydrogenase
MAHCRRARLLAYRVIALQNEGRVRPTDTASYRIAVTRLDQESADVLVEMLTAGTPTGPLAQWWRREVEDHWRYSQAATVSSGAIEIQRILLARGLLSPQGVRT